jgi:hypothetical protein
MKGVIVLFVAAACGGRERVVVRGPADGEKLPACQVDGELQRAYFAPVVAYARTHLIQRMNADPTRDGLGYLVEPGTATPDNDGLSFIVDQRRKVGKLEILNKRGEWRSESRYALHVTHSGPLTTVVTFRCQ